MFKMEILKKIILTFTLNVIIESHCIGACSSSSVSSTENQRNSRTIQKREEDDDDDENDDDEDNEYYVEGEGDSKYDEYTIVEKGEEYHSSFRTYIKDGSDRIVSPIHDIPLKQELANGGSSYEIYNMVVEIPRWTNAKMEISLQEKMNPILQDLNKDGNVRFTSNCFPFKGYIWNYGILPQTWENPDVADITTGLKGDGDPIDVIEIGDNIYPIGSVVPVKVIGVIGLIDGGETDWKLISIAIKDSKANDITTIKDIEHFKPGLLNATITWFRDYKTPEGKPKNSFAFDGKPQNSEFAKTIIDEVNDHWIYLMEGKDTKHKIDRSCTQCDYSSRISENDAKDLVDGQPELKLYKNPPLRTKHVHYCK